MSEAMKAVATLYNNPRYTSPSEIRRQNNLKRRQRIVRHQYMLIGSAVAILILLLSLSMTTILSDASSNEHLTSFKYYKTVTVHSGDNLTAIATENFDTEHYKNMNAYLNEIRTLNHLASIDDITAGECLIIPYYSTEFK